MGETLGEEFFLHYVAFNGKGIPSRAEPAICTLSGRPTGHPYRTGGRDAAGHRGSLRQRILLAAETVFDVRLASLLDVVE